jgi:5'(3')-deoxyribonucleotidase
MNQLIARQIFVDMDDVVADWRTAAELILGQSITSYIGSRVPNSEWNRIKENKRFYRWLPVRPGAKELMSWLQQYESNHDNVHLGFLTAIPRDNDMPWAIYDKVLWAQHLFPNIPVFFGPYSKDKLTHAKPGDILIDDRKSNILDWTNAGGVGHLYRDWPECKQWLELTLHARY